MRENYVLNLENIYVRELIFGGIMYKNNHQKFGNIFPENSIALLQVRTKISDLVDWVFSSVKHPFKLRNLRFVRLQSVQFMVVSFLLMFMARQYFVKCQWFGTRGKHIQTSLYLIWMLSSMWFLLKDPPILSKTKLAIGQ